MKKNHSAKRQPNYGLQRRAYALIRQVTVFVVISQGMVWFANPASGFGTNVGIGYGLGYSDNVDQDSSDEIKSFSHNYLLDIRSEETSSTFDFNAGGTISYLDYVNSDVDDEPELNFDAGLTWRIVPQRFIWTVNNSARPVRIDRTGPSNTNNQEIQNVFLTGPTLLFQFTPITSLSLEAQYGNYYFSETDEDNNQRLKTAARLSNKRPGNIVLSLNSEFSLVKYKDSSNQDFNRHDLFFGVNYETTFSTLRADAGFTQVFSKEGEDQSKPLLRLGISRKLTTDSEVGFNYSAELSDLDFTRDTPLDTTLGRDFVTTEITYDKSLNIFYNARWRSLQGSLNLAGRKIDSNVSDDEDQRGLNFRLAYTLAQDKRFEVFGAYLRTNLADSSTNKETALGGRFVYNITRSIESRFELSNFSNDNDQDDTEDYDETRGLISIFYRTDFRFQ